MLYLAGKYGGKIVKKSYIQCMRHISFSGEISRKKST